MTANAIYYYIKNILKQHPKMILRIGMQKEGQTGKIKFGLTRSKNELKLN